MKRKLKNRIKCLFGKHGPIVGGMELLQYDNDKRIFRYRSFLKCKHCGKEIENETAS